MKNNFNRISAALKKNPENVQLLVETAKYFIRQNNLTKSTMKLYFDENEFKSLLSNIKIEKTVSGGSVANSIVGLSQLGNQVGLI